MADINKLINDLSVQADAVKPMPHPFLSFLKWSLGAFIYLGLLITCFHIRGDIDFKFHSPPFLIELGLLAAMILSSGISTIMLSFPDMYQKRWVVFMPVITLIFFCTVMIIEWIDDMPPSPKPEHGIECLLCILCYSIIPACWIFYWLRKSATTHGALAGFVAVLGTYSIGCLALRISEQTDSITHLVQWHYVPMMCFSVLGLWGGRKFLKW